MASGTPAAPSQAKARPEPAASATLAHARERVGAAEKAGKQEVRNGEGFTAWATRNVQSALTRGRRGNDLGKRGDAAEASLRRVEAEVASGRLRGPQAEERIGAILSTYEDGLSSDVTRLRGENEKFRNLDRALKGTAALTAGVVATAATGGTFALAAGAAASFAASESLNAAEATEARGRSDALAGATGQRSRELDAIAREGDGLLLLAADHVTGSAHAGEPDRLANAARTTGLNLATSAIGAKSLGTAATVTAKVAGALGARGASQLVIRAGSTTAGGLAAQGVSGVGNFAVGLADRGLTKGRLTRGDVTAELARLGTDLASAPAAVLTGFLPGGAGLRNAAVSYVGDAATGLAVSRLRGERLDGFVFAAQGIASGGSTAQNLFAHGTRTPVEAVERQLGHQDLQTLFEAFDKPPSRERLRADLEQFRKDGAIIAAYLGDRDEPGSIPHAFKIEIGESSGGNFKTRFDFNEFSKLTLSKMAEPERVAFGHLARVLAVLKAKRPLTVSLDPETRRLTGELRRGPDSTGPFDLRPAIDATAEHLPPKARSAFSGALDELLAVGQTDTFDAMFSDKLIDDRIADLYGLAGLSANSEPTFAARLLAGFKQIRIENGKVEKEIRNERLKAEREQARRPYEKIFERGGAIIDSGVCIEAGLGPQAAETVRLTAYMTNKTRGSLYRLIDAYRSLHAEAHKDPYAALRLANAAAERREVPPRGPGNGAARASRVTDEVLARWAKEPVRNGKGEIEYKNLFGFVRFPQNDPKLKHLTTALREVGVAMDGRNPRSVLDGVLRLMSRKDPVAKAAVKDIPKSLKSFVQAAASADEAGNLRGWVPVSGASVGTASDADIRSVLGPDVTIAGGIASLDDLIIGSTPDGATDRVRDFKARSGAAVGHYAEKIAGMIPEAQKGEVVFVPVPSSTPGRITANDLLGRALKKKGFAVDPLIVSPFGRIPITVAGPEARTLERNTDHFFLVKNPEEGKTYVLLDDVTTSGKTLAILSEILRQRGAGSVVPLSIGKVTHAAQQLGYVNTILSDNNPLKGSLPAGHRIYADENLDRLHVWAARWDAYLHRQQERITAEDD